VTLQLAQLFELSRERDIRERLGKLPDTLNKAYDEIYSQIQDQKGSSCDIANRAFQWIMYSRDPLSPDELVAAACQDPETEDVDNIDIDIDTVLGACCNLLVVDQQLKICKFSHLSVQEYLENHHWSYAKSNALIAKVCLTLLNHPIYQLQDIDDIDEGFSSDASCLLTYARFHWATHVQEYGESDIDSHLVSRLKKFLGSLNESSPAYQNWYSSIEKHFASDRSFYFGMPLYRIYKELSPSSRSILSISVFGFHAVISDWWTVASVYVEQTNCKGTTPLQLASIGGFIAVIQELTGREADVNAQGGSFGSALYEASYRGHEMVVRLLLEKGADVNAKGGKYGSALQAASDDGHEMVVRLLLDKGADVNAKGGKYGSALQAASYRGHEMVVRLLLEKGANINAMGGRYGSALQTASYHGHEMVVRLLLEKEADNNAKGEGMYGSALLAASSRGYEMVVRLLLEKGTNINAMGGRYGSALQAASDGGHEAVMRLLLDKGADANAKGGGYGSALQAASEGGHETAMRLL